MTTFKFRWRNWRRLWTRARMLRFIRHYEENVQKRHDFGVVLFQIHWSSVYMCCHVPRRSTTSRSIPLCCFVVHCVCFGSMSVSEYDSHHSLQLLFIYILYNSIIHSHLHIFTCICLHATLHLLSLHTTLSICLPCNFPLLPSALQCIGAISRSVM